MMDFSIFTEPAAWLSLLTLTFMEIVLGIDNIIFISIITNKLPKSQQPRARAIGLSMALLFRIALLIFITKLVGLVDPLFMIPVENWFTGKSPEVIKEIVEISGRDLILFAGGIFLIAKSTSEINGTLEGFEVHKQSKGSSLMQFVILQVIILDIVFSIDSILTAVGLVKEVLIMIIAVIISLFIMLIFSRHISDFIQKHPSLKMLALSFLLMIGFLLCVESVGVHVPKGYVYTAMFFSVFVEFLNISMRKKRRKPVDLHEPEFKVEEN